MRLKGKAAIITGAARGIGAAFAGAYVREGATVAIADIDMIRAVQTAKAIGPSAFAIRLDVTDQAREVLDRLDAAMRDELQARADLEIHGLEIDILGFEFGRLSDVPAMSADR